MILLEPGLSVEEHARTQATLAELNGVSPPIVTLAALPGSEEIRATRSGSPNTQAGVPLTHLAEVLDGLAVMITTKGLGPQATSVVL